MYSRQIKNKPKLYIHIFPSAEFDWDCIKLDNEKKILYVRHFYDFHSSVQIDEIPKFWCFKNDGIFLNSCPSEVYGTVLGEISDQIHCGVDNVVMSYGQNYSGKTFTLSGLDNQYELRGIIPRFVNELFGQRKINKDDLSTEAWLSIVDIDGNNIYDLSANSTKKCKSSREVQQIRIKSELHCFQLLFKAEAHRKSTTRKAYKSQVRSNVVTFTFKLKTLSYHEPHDKFSKVHFVDLAGVETIERSHKTSFKEQINQSSANITKSLLEILALNFHKEKLSSSSPSQRIHKLTQYLGNSLSPRSFIKLICHIRPHCQDIMITLSALRFGMTFKNIPVLKAEMHSSPNNERVIENLQHQVKSLENELLIRNLWSDVSPMSISQDRISFVQRVVKSFLKDELSEKELISVIGDCGMILNVVRSIEKDRQSKESKELGVQTKESEPNLRKNLIPNISPRASQLKEKTISRPSTRHVSFSKTKDTKIIEKEEKSKKDAKRDKEKSALVSEEVQVNLIEPDATLPDIDSRENLWARFMIHHPEIEQGLSNLQRGVGFKQKQLNKEAVKLEGIGEKIEAIKCSIEQLNTDEKLCKKKADDEEINLISEEKKNLLHELESLQLQMDTTQQKVIDAKIEWVEAMENLSKAKQIVEGVFNRFCKQYNLLALYSESPIEKESDIVEIKSELKLRPSDHMKDYFTKLQNKYLHNGN